MTRIEARIAVRMLGVLVIGLTIAPALGNLARVPLSILEGLFGVIPPDAGNLWVYSLGWLVQATIWTVMLVAGLVLLSASKSLAPILFRESIR